MTVRKIVEAFLKANGYDGLVNHDAECGCALGDGFVPCDGMMEKCNAGYFCHHKKAGQDYQGECEGEGFCQCIGKNKLHP